MENSFVQKLRTENLITNFEISDKSIKAICNIDYIVSNETSTNAYIVRIINQLRKAFPKKENYHVKLGKDDFSDFIVDNEKNINRTNMPIDAMHEIRACIVNQYKNKIGVPNKKDYASMLISRRKEIVTANQRFANAFSTFLKKGKIKPAEIDEAHELCISSTSKEIPALSYISSNEFGYGTTENGDLEKIISNNDCGENSSWYAFVKSINEYESNLLGFYRHIPTTLSDKNIAVFKHMLRGHAGEKHQIDGGGADDVAVFHRPQADVGMVEKRGAPQVDDQADEGQGARAADFRSLPPIEIVAVDADKREREHENGPQRGAYPVDAQQGDEHG